MTPAERNSVIDECIKLVQRYDELQHQKLRLRQRLVRAARSVPDSTQGAILLGLKDLKTLPPLRAKVTVKPIIVYGPQEEENVKT